MQKDKRRKTEKHKRTYVDRTEVEREKEKHKHRDVDRQKQKERERGKTLASPRQTWELV